MYDSLLLALEGFALVPFIWMIISRWECSDMKSSKVVIYPTPLMVKLVKGVLAAVLVLLWLSAIGDLLDG